MPKKSKLKKTKTEYSGDSMPPICTGIVVQKDGSSWCCSPETDEHRSLSDQGCWEIDDYFNGSER